MGEFSVIINLVLKKSYKIVTKEATMLQINRESETFMNKIRRTINVGALAAIMAAGMVHSPVFAASDAAAPAPATVEAQKAAEAVSVTVGDAVFYLKNSADYDAFMAKLQNRFKAEGATVRRMDIEPEIKAEAVKTEEKILTVDEAFKLLLTGGKEEAVYVAEETESLESVAKKFNMTVDEIKALNADWEDPLHKGSKITVLKPAPMITVTLEQEKKAQSAVAFKTVEKEDPNQVKSVRKVVRAGKAGTMETTTRVESENGKVTASVTEASRLIQEPVDEIVAVGTKEGLATGSFMTPTVGRLSSPFGPRWGRFHYGIDLANATGTDVVAADGGVVTRAGMAGSYGNLIIIDHQNGTSTRYAHLSAFNVKAGDVVQKGQSIGKIGSTGRSTGPHLHFEVRVGGVAKNPLEFIKL